MATTNNGLLETFQKHIEDMRQLSLCKICLNPFYEPFVLACGHSYCYSCLANWFSGTHNQGRKKNCPDCRSEVKIQPSPNYLLRDLVHMFISRAELLPEDETVEKHQEAKEAEAAIMAADRADKGLFRGVFTRAKVPRWTHGLPHFLGSGIIHDAEDNVDRCPNCTWEIVDGACAHCGWEPGVDDVDDSADSEEGDEDVSSLSESTMDSELDQEFDPVDEEMAAEIMMEHMPAFLDTHSAYFSDENDSDSIAARPSRVRHRNISPVFDPTLTETDSFIDDEDRSIPISSNDDSENDSVVSQRSYSTPPAVSRVAITGQSESRWDNRNMTHQSHTGHIFHQSPPRLFYGVNSDAGGSDTETTTSQPTNYEDFSDRRSTTTDDGDEDDHEDRTIRLEQDLPSVPIFRRPTARRIIDSDDEEEIPTTQEPSGTAATVDESSEESDDTAVRPPQPVRARRQRLDWQRSRRNPNQIQPHNRGTTTDHNSRPNPFQERSTRDRGRNTSHVQTSRRNWPAPTTYVH